MIKDVVEQFQKDYKGITLTEDNYIKGFLIREHNPVYRESIIGKLEDDGEITELHQHYGLHEDMPLRGYYFKAGVPEEDINYLNFNSVEELIEWAKKDEDNIIVYEFDDLKELN